VANIGAGTRKKSGRRKAVALKGQTNIAGLSARRAEIHPLDRAIAELRSELARTPDDHTILSRLGALFYRRGDVLEAENYYRKAIAIAPNRPSLFNNLGNVLCDMGRMRDGIAAYEHAMSIEKALDPGRAPSPEAEANLELARMEYRLIHERVEYLEKAAQLEVSSAEAGNALGCGYLLCGRREKALEAFRQAAALDPRNVYAGLNIAFTQTLNLSGSADMNAAVAEVAESIIRFPGEPRLHIHQGELLENNGILEDAEERYIRAIQADPRSYEAYDVLGRLREATGYAHTRDETAQAVDQALQTLEKNARELRVKESSASGPLPLYDLAFVEIARARFMRRPVAHAAAVERLLREAIAAGKQTKSGTPRDNRSTESPARNVAAHAAILRARLLEAEGRRDEARVVLESVSAADPECARLWMERGSLALRAGAIEEALEFFDKATLRMPQDAVACHSLRFAFEGYRRYRTERVRFETATKADARDGLAHHHLALAALSVLKDEEALFHFTRALELDPRLSDAACGRGRALERMGHFDEAEAAYIKALDIDPENPEAQRALIALRSRNLLNSAASSLFISEYGRGKGRMDD
jgi:Flp pilus assembly protein TadD